MKEALLSETVKWLEPFAIVLVSGAVTWVLAQIRLKYKSETAQNILSHMDEFAKLVVLEMDQTLVQPFKLATADGKLTKQEVDQIKTTAIRRFETLLGDQGLKKARAIFGDVSSALYTMIEA